jgi:peptidase E
VEARRTIVAFGGGGFSMEAGNPLLDDYVLGLLDVPRPRLCFLPSASGDADHYIVRFYREFAHRAECSHLSLFRRDHRLDELRDRLLEQDLIYVGGGSVISLLGVWRAHGLDAVLKEAWEKGVVLCGVSAGSLCWFTEGVTAFHGTPRRYEGLGFLPWSNTVHYDTGGRRDAYREMLKAGMAPGYAACDGAGLHFEGDRLVRVVGSRPGAEAFRMSACKGGVKKRPLNVDYLGTGLDRVAQRPTRDAPVMPLPMPAAAVSAAAAG